MAKNKVVTKTKRTNGEGSIFQRKDTGIWVGSLTIGYDEKGRQKRNDRSRFGGEVISNLQRRKPAASHLEN